MTPVTRQALAVKSRVVDVMKEHVYGGDFDRPRLKPDPAGAYHFKDRFLNISCIPSGRDGWLNCSVAVSLVRGRWPFRKLEPVLVTGFGVDVSVFRPGHWVDYLSSLAEHARGLQSERDDATAQNVEESAQAKHDANFSPVDDSALFKK